MSDTAAEDTTDTEQSQTAGFEEYFIGTLIAIVAITFSFGGALLMNIGADPLLGQALGAAWAWALGVGSQKWWIPWVKQAMPAGL